MITEVLLLLPRVGCGAGGCCSFRDSNSFIYLFITLDFFTGVASTFYLGTVTELLSFRIVVSVELTRMSAPANLSKRLVHSE